MSKQKGPQPPPRPGSRLRPGRVVVRSAAKAPVTPPKRVTRAPAPAAAKRKPKAPAKPAAGSRDAQDRVATAAAEEVAAQVAFPTVTEAGIAPAPVVAEAPAEGEPTVAAPVAPQPKRRHPGRRSA